MAYNDDLTTPATGDAAMRRLKDQLVAGGWTVAASGDGRSAYEAAGDAITADSGAGSFDASGAWARLRMDGATRELLFVRGAASTTWTVRYSVAGFSGGSPSATVAPTATDSKTLASAAQLLPADGTYRWLVCVEDAAPYHVGAYAVPIAGGAPNTAICVWPMRSGSYPSVDADPYAVTADYDVTSVLTTARVGGGTDTTGAWERYGETSSEWRRAGFCWPTSGVGTTVGAAGAHRESGEQLPIEIPVALMTFHPIWGGPKGYLRDGRYCLSSAASVSHGAHLQQGSGYFIRLGDMWVSWSSTAPAL